ncbi:acyltransferase [Streptomyces sp. NBC_01808]|uniref:acyltransferase n=1 Tax=Streptomyces sp. NBC_01808 TaxID=2975947 RepID=UPI002DD89EA4|nr:acyltransferase [Streptomyces sp. NBC_01808]WSA35988.1 acyltransferase [Streptomyces sp. NBC_01808]
MSGGDRPGRYDYCPWLFFGSATDEERAAQSAWHGRLAERLALHGGETELAQETFVSTWAGIFTDRLRMGRRSYIAAHAYVTGELTTGRDCTVNPFTTVRGRVRMGDGVRVGAHSSVLGFNHSTAVDRPVHKQPLTSRGIEIGDDVWIGSHVVVVDGVSIGSHCIVGAGAVVTKDLPDWSVAAGNPARRLRDRRDPPAAGDPGVTAAGVDRPNGPSTAHVTPVTRAGSAVPAADVAAETAETAELAERLARFAARAREQAPDVLARCLGDGAGGGGGPGYADRPGAPPTVRAQCDAVEIAHLLLREAPPRTTADDLAAHLRGLQDPDTGLVPEYAPDGGAPAWGHSHARPRGVGEPILADDAALYHILSVGYALELLGTRFSHPVRAVHELTPQQLTARLDALPWERAAWRAGHWVDGVGTAVLHNLVDFGMRAPAADALFGWLLTHADPWHGLWGRPTPKDRWLQPVNGFYRTSRGTFAQFGLPLPYPERVVDTVLAHSGDTAFFGPGRGDACNVLDVIHPLWLSSRQTRHRLDEGRRWARERLARVLANWHDGAGFSFALEPGAGPGHEPGLQGTEMWLAVVWLLADHLGIAGALGYRPGGVHRPEPARLGLGEARY